MQYTASQTKHTTSFTCLIHSCVCHLYINLRREDALFFGSICKRNFHKIQRPYSASFCDIDVYTPMHLQIPIKVIILIIFFMITGGSSCCVRIVQSWYCAVFVKFSAFLTFPFTEASRLCATQSVSDIGRCLHVPLVELVLTSVCSFFAMLIDTVKTATITAWACLPAYAAVFGCLFICPS